MPPTLAALMEPMPGFEPGTYGLRSQSPRRTEADTARPATPFRVVDGALPGLEGAHTDRPRSTVAADPVLEKLGAAAELWHRQQNPATLRCALFDLMKALDAEHVTANEDEDTTE